jgi:hypothetical protein
MALALATLLLAGAARRGVTHRPSFDVQGFRPDND